MRALTVSFTAWTLWNMLRFWLDADRVTNAFSSYLERDVHGMASWQRLSGLGLDLVTWALLLTCVVYAWKLLGNLKDGRVFHRENVNQLKRCAYFAIASDAFNWVNRPLVTYLATAHLPSGQQVFRWDVLAHNMTAQILCLALLMFAFVYGWALDIAEENQQFI